MALRWEVRRQKGCRAWGSASQFCRAHGLQDVFLVGGWGRGLVTLEVACPCTIEATLRLHSNRLFALDRMFQLDLCVMEQITGAEGASLLRSSFVEKCMATAEKEVNVDDAVTAGKQLLLSPAYVWAAPEAKADIKEGVNMLVRLQAAEPIITSSAQVSDWLAQVRVNFAYFLRERILPAGAAGGADRAKLLVGREALKHKWGVVRADPSPKLEAYRIFAVWKHLMDPEMESELTEVQKTILLNAAQTFKNGVASRVKGEPKKKMQRRSVEDDLDATAMAMLGMT